jgi:hypothetical protein
MFMKNPPALNGDAIAARTFPKQKILAWGNLVTLTLWVIYFAVLMEWLYQVTKPSFMDFMPFVSKLGILMGSGLLLLLLSLPLFLILFAASMLVGRSRFWKVFLWVGSILPAAFLASIALLLIDNFTYTLFHFGIINTRGIQRGIYGVVFIFLLVGSTLWVVQKLRRQMARDHIPLLLKWQFLSAAALLVLSLPLSAALYASMEDTASIPATGSAERRPNILLIGTDAMNADHMSLYGYGRDTTPFLKSFAQTALLSENNFPNASISAGSFASIFTGKLPTTTRVLFPPDTLKGADAVEHFPGILENEGYYTAEISVDYYADANQMNVQDGFFLVNNRAATMPAVYSAVKSYVPEDVAYFLSTTAKYLTDRLLHITYLRTMSDPLAEVYQGINTTTDRQRIDQTLALFQNTQQPLFVNVYMLGTHSGVIAPHNRVFSKGETLNNANGMDFYDDAVLDFDQYMHEVTDALAKMSKLDQTIIIIYSDHGIGDVSNVRLPLMIRFPGGEYAGKMTHNTQNLDIAPTLLDYMGIPQPAWMAGQSLLKGEPPANRPIFSAVPNFTFLNSLNQLQLDPKKTKPPFYQFGLIGMVICQNKYTLDTSSLIWNQSTIPNYPTPCAPDSLPPDRQARQMMVNQLKADGFDVSSLNELPDDPRK